MASTPGPTLSPLNTSQAVPTSFPFTLLAPPRTDLYPYPRPVPYSPNAAREIPTVNPGPGHSANQPTFYTTVKLSQFIRVSLTFTLQPEVKWDQAGLVILYGSDERKWVKTGVELTEGYREPMEVVVASKAQAGMESMMSPLEKDSIDSAGRIRTTVEMVRGEGEESSSLLVKFDGKMLPGITWDFAEEDEEVKVGFYAARPLGDNKGIMEAMIEGWEIETK